MPDASIILLCVAVIAYMATVFITSGVFNAEPDSHTVQLSQYQAVNDQQSPPVFAQGGEAGFASRTPEMNLTDATLSGTTTVVAALGTDSSSRTLTNLVAKAKGLKEQGLNVFCHTGSYHLPAKTLTHSITDDIMYIEEFIGVGEVAISDHRRSQPTVQQLAELAAEAKVAGMLSGKKGTVSIHVGPVDSHLTILHQVAEQSDIKLKQFYPTHMNRNKALLDAGIHFCDCLLYTSPSPRD